MDLRSHRRALAAVAIVLTILPLATRPAGADVHVRVAAQAQPGPPYPPPPPSYSPPPVYYYPPPPPRVVDPPPLSPVMRAVYAPFYAAGLVLRYGAYYLIVAPFEVFGRALNYGTKGGVERPRRQEGQS